MLIALVLTYLLRGLFINMFLMEEPRQGDLWEYPGFNSLTVPYGRSNDYFYNPVIALCTLLIKEFNSDNSTLLKYMSVLALCGNFYLSLALRGHYLMDNFGGLVLAAYIWEASNNWLSYYVDVKLFGMTFQERF